MRLIGEICKALGAELGAQISYTVIGAQGGYFQNVKKIAEFSPDAIVFCGRKDKVRVEGRELSLGKYFGGDAAVKGEIVRVERI